MRISLFAIMMVPAILAETVLDVEALDEEITMEGLEKGLNETLFGEEDFDEVRTMEGLDKGLNESLFGEEDLDEVRTTDNLAKSLQDHQAYFASKFNWNNEDFDSRAVDPATAATTVQTMVAAADQLTVVIQNTKDIFLKELEEEIKQINLQVEGITHEQRTIMEKALNEVLNAQGDIFEARANLESLAEETITRVNQMLYYLSLVKDNWSSATIGKFLKFEAKKMAQLIDRSLSLLKEAMELYNNTRKSLNKVKASLTSFQNFVKNLANGNSESHKDRVKKFRLSVYIPCALFPPAIPVCVATLESVIAKWESSLNNLNAIVLNNNRLTGNILGDVDTSLGDMKKDTKLIIKWQGALILVQSVDWTFPEAEFLGFADSKPPVIESLNNLKTAAQNYLDGGKGSSGPCATFYEHHKYTGKSLPIQEGKTPFSIFHNNGFNDGASSIRVKSGCKVQYWEHASYNGKTGTATQDTSYVGGHWNDKISSASCAC